MLRSATAAAALSSLLHIAPLAVAADAEAAPPAVNLGLGNPLTSPERRQGCLASGNGYLRARIRGALQLDINLRDAQLDCDGGARPDGSGIRVSFAGPQHSDGHRLRMVFGVATLREGRSGHALPTNLTVILEGEQRLFATRGDDKCTVDQLTQEPLGTPGGSRRVYRIVARGFCIAPVPALTGAGEIVINSFDFAGRVTFEDGTDNGAAARQTGRH